MKMRIRIKKWNILLLIVFLVFIINILIVFNYIINSTPNNHWNIKYKSKYFNFNELDSNNWIFNFNVTQYSTIITKSSDELIFSESLIFLDHILNNMDYLNNNLKCLIKINEVFFVLNPYEILLVPIMKIPNWPKQMYKVKCEIRSYQLKYLKRSDSSLENEQIKLAIIDFKYFEYLTNLYAKLKENYLIQLHKPNQFYMNKPKKKAIAHCVHTVRNLNDEKRLKYFFEWVKIQKTIGIDKIKIYLMTDLEQDPIENKIREEFNDGFINIIKYRTSLYNLCKIFFDKLTTKTEYNRLNYYLYRNCEKSFIRHFRGSIKNEWVLNSHERLTSNDCLLNFKYDYELVTNYDFDEIILPRNISLDHSYTNFNNEYNLCNNNTNKETKFIYENKLNNLYNYAIKLFEHYGVENTASLRFEHAVIVKEYDRLNNFIFKLRHDISKIIRFNYNKTHFLDIKYEKDNKNHLKNYKDLKLIVDCLNKTEESSLEKISKKWNNPYFIRINIRDGKSIFNTNLTEIYNQHYAELPSNKLKQARIPLEYGFLNHFRDNIGDFFLNQTYSFDNLIIDLEYYLFFISTSKINIINF
jgi:hypothetical protein